jgi:hypothetical protein
MPEEGLQSDIDIEMVREWLKSPITTLFFANVQAAIEECDNGVHASLRAGVLEEAAQYNAGKFALEEVLEIPTDIINELKGEEEGDDTEAARV